MLKLCVRLVVLLLTQLNKITATLADIMRRTQINNNGKGNINGKGNDNGIVNNNVSELTI